MVVDAIKFFINKKFGYRVARMFISMPNRPILVYFGRTWVFKIWFISWSFGILLSFWEILWLFGIFVGELFSILLCQEKSGISALV
jgi:hypothetical protein